MSFVGTQLGRIEKISQVHSCHLFVAFGLMVLQLDTKEVSVQIQVIYSSRCQSDMSFIVNNNLESLRNPQLPHQHSVPIVGSITPVSINKFKKEEEKTLFTNNLHSFHKHFLKITKSISYYIFVYILMTDLTERWRLSV